MLDHIKTKWTAYRKRTNELKYWSKRKRVEGSLHNDHYQQFYTEHFGLTLADYEGLRILDIGCGPRGSLDWAEMAAERVGLDPLADSYRELRPEGYRMEMVASGSESIPYPDGHFDIVCSFNSLDHVDDLDETIAEIRRVVRPGGHFFLLTDLNHKATACEPIEFGWEIVDHFTDAFEVIEERRYEKGQPGIYESILANVPYDEVNTEQRCGIISVKCRRLTTAEEATTP